MSGIFSQILNMSITGSIVILFVLLARVVLKRAPKIFSYALWSVVLFRLLCPVSFSAPVSVLDAAAPQIRESSGNANMVSFLPEEAELHTDYAALPAETQPLQQEIFTETGEQLQMTPAHATCLLWLAGMAGMIVYSAAQYFLLKRRLVGSVSLWGNIYLADHLDTAFVLGLWKPKIYLPSGLTEEERAYILAHEQQHIRRFDHVTRLLSYFALCIHWFNPLVWAAFALSGKDMEMSCDEAVLRRLGTEIRADYSASLLRLTTQNKILSGMPLAFGEGDTKGRVLNMAKWNKPAKWLVVICLILCLCVVALCAFNPEGEQDISEFTRRTSETPVGTGVGDLYFTYPAGLTHELQEAENWTRAEELRRWLGLPNRNQWVHIFSYKGTVFGGIVDFIVPENRKILLEEMELPSEWTGLAYTSADSVYPYAEKEYTLLRDGKDYIRIYLYTYSGRGYFLWFYADQGIPYDYCKQEILQSVEVGSGGRYASRLKQEEEISLGLFNAIIPKGYGYYRNETVLLEIMKKDPLGKEQVVASVTARPVPDVPMDEDLTAWAEALGVDLYHDKTSSGYHIMDDSDYGDVNLFVETAEAGRRTMAENHYFYIAGNIVYDVCFDAMEMDENEQKSILKTIWIKAADIKLASDVWVTAAAPTPITIGQLPQGYNYGFDKDLNLVFAWGGHVVGGVISYTIPEGLYDPQDKSYHWLEEMGIPDFEDPNLIYLGGMTDGDNGWSADFADDARNEANRTVERHHSFRVVEDTLYDIWFDLQNISWESMQELQAAIKLPVEKPPEE